MRYWTRRYLLRVPIPLTGAAALRAEVSWKADAWIPAFLRALEKVAAHGLDLLTTLERAWLARALLGHRRKTSHAASAVDLLAATPLMSVTTLASALGIAVKNAIRILDQLSAAGIALELTGPRPHRSLRPDGDAARPLGGKRSVRAAVVRQPVRVRAVVSRLPRDGGRVVSPGWP